MQTRILFWTSAAILLSIASGAPIGHGEKAITQKDHLSFIEHAETRKVAADVAERIVNTQGTAATEIPATKEDQLLACSAAHGGFTSVETAPDANFLKFVTANAQDDPQVSRAAQTVAKNTGASFSVAAWPLREASQRGTYVILVFLHPGAAKQTKIGVINVICR